MADRDNFDRSDYDKMQAATGGSKVADHYDGNQVDDYGDEYDGHDVQRSKKATSGAKMRKISKKRYEEVADYDDEEESSGGEAVGRPLAQMASGNSEEVSEVKKQLEWFCF